MDTRIDWPPPHTFRRSKRARRISLRILPGKGLEIVLPERPLQQVCSGLPFFSAAKVMADERMGLEALERHKDWVLRNLVRLCGSFGGSESGCGVGGVGWGQNDYGQEDSGLVALGGCGAADVYAAGAYDALPEYLCLHGGLTRLRLDWGHRELYLPGLHEVLSAMAKNETLLCRLKAGTLEQKWKRLRLWLRSYAEQYLGARLSALSALHGLAYSHMRTGWQRSRWGSYSRQGAVSLNAKLVFLPTDLCDMVLLHELCHSLEMSHNKHFHTLLRKYEPRADELERALGQAGVWLPAWCG